MDEEIYQIPQAPAQVSPINLGNFANESIASMRWESDPIAINLRVRLGGYIAQPGKDGVTTLVRPKGVRPMVNDTGIDRFVALIQGVVNPVTSLSNIDDQEANTLARQVLHDLIYEIAYNKDRFDIHSGDMRTITSILKLLVFMQLKRAVTGHESKNSRTQTVEQTLTHHSQTQRQHNPFWGTKKQAS